MLNDISSFFDTCLDYVEKGFEYWYVIIPAALLIGVFLVLKSFS